MSGGHGRGGSVGVPATKNWTSRSYLAPVPAVRPVACRAGERQLRGVVLRETSNSPGRRPFRARYVRCSWLPDVVLKNVLLVVAETLQQVGVWVQHQVRCDGERLHECL